MCYKHKLTYTHAQTCMAQIGLHTVEIEGECERERKKENPLRQQCVQTE